MSGSCSPPLPLLYLEFRYLFQTKHLCFLHSWGNKSFCLEAVNSTNRSNKSLQGWQIQGQSMITWHTGETSLSISLHLPQRQQGREGADLPSLVTSSRSEGMNEAESGHLQTGHWRKVLHWEGGWSLGQAAQRPPLPLVVATSLPEFKEHLGCSGWHSQSQGSVLGTPVTLQCPFQIKAVCESKLK